MKTTRWVAVGTCITLLAAATSAGCNSPSSICEDHRAAYNAAFARCDIPAELPVKWLTWSGGPCDGMATSCENVTKVTDASKILDDCIPGLERIDCDTLAADPEGPSACRASVYQFTGSGADRCD